MITMPVSKKGGDLSLPPTASLPQSLSTVGYGDVVPHTTPEVVFTTFLELVGGDLSFSCRTLKQLGHRTGPWEDRLGEAGQSRPRKRQARERRSPASPSSCLRVTGVVFAILAGTLTAVRSSLSERLCSPGVVLDLQNITRHLL